MSSTYPQRHHRERCHTERWGACFEVNAACRFWWPSHGGDPAFGLGQTTELGIGSVSVLSSVLPPLGSPLMLEVDLPRLDMSLPETALTEFAAPDLSEDPFLLLTAEGTVLHHHREGHGFSALITQTSFAHKEKRSA